MLLWKWYFWDFYFSYLNFFKPRNITRITKKSLEHQRSNWHSIITKYLTRASRSNTGTDGDLSIDTACDPNDCPLPSVNFSEYFNCSVDGQPVQHQNGITTSGSSCAVTCSTGYHQRTDNTLDCYAGSLTPSILHCDPDPCDVRGVAILYATDVGCFSTTDGSRAVRR